MRFSLYSELQLHPGTEPAQLYAEALGKAGYGFYASRITERLAEVPYEQLVEDDDVWVGTPEDIIERIEQTREICPGVTEIGITVNAGAPHWMAIKNQELFASRVAAHFRAQKPAEAATVPTPA